MVSRRTFEDTCVGITSFVCPETLSLNAVSTVSGIKLSRYQKTDNSRRIVRMIEIKKGKKSEKR